MTLRKISFYNVFIVGVEQFFLTGLTFQEHALLLLVSQVIIEIL